MSLSPEGLTKAMGASTSSCAPEGSHTSRLPSPQVLDLWASTRSQSGLSVQLDCLPPAVAPVNCPNQYLNLCHLKRATAALGNTADCSLSSHFLHLSVYPNSVTMYTVSKPVSPVRLGSLKLSLCVLTCPS